MALLARTATLPGETRSAVDHLGKVYVVDAAFGVIQIDPVTGAQREYATGFGPRPALTLPGDLTFDRRR